MLSRAQVKYIRSLKQQKYRKEHRAFLVEGSKIVAEWLASTQPVNLIVATPDWVATHQHLLQKRADTPLHVVKESELQEVSALQSAQEVLLVAILPSERNSPSTHGWTLALDRLQDPGNVGTILRIADWFGIPEVVCSPDTADAYNPKVVQAAMGAHLRVKILEQEMPSFLHNQSRKKFASVLSGRNVHSIGSFPEGILLVGNESKGLSETVLAYADELITIPGSGQAESLNAAVATGIFCAMLLPH